MLSNQELDSYLKELFGSRYLEFLTAKNEQRAVRVNTLKSTTQNFENFLSKLNYTFREIPYQTYGYILSDDPAPLSHTLAYFKGLFMYQGLSSQLPVLLLEIKPGERVLDMAAAPGSKSTQLASELQNKGILVLNDYSTNRLQALSANMQRSGAVNFCILKHRGQNFGPLLPEFFDKVLCDVPCSALGTLNTNPEISSWWSLKKLHKLAQIQYYMLVSALKVLKVGGELVYSTCTITPEENEMVINRLLDNYPVEILSLPASLSDQFSPGMTHYKNNDLSPELRRALRIYPDQHQMEGFFMIKLKKTAATSQLVQVDSSNWKQTYSADQLDISKILGEISEIWGIPQSEWANYRYYLTTSRIWMVSIEMDRLVHDGFVSAGMLLAEKRITGWKLVHGSIQYFNKYISKRRLNLDDQMLKNIFSTGRIDYSNVPGGYYALTYQEEPIASIFADAGQLRIRLPHSFNLVL